MSSDVLQSRIKYQMEILNKQLEAKKRYGFGYKAERSDVRDYNKFTLQNPQRFDDPDKKEIAEIFTSSVEIDKADPAKEDNLVDFRDEFPPIRNQGPIGQCVKYSEDSIIGHMRKTQYNEIVETSPRYGYKKVRDMANETGDVGATIRGGIKSLVTFGYVLEEHWPQNYKEFDAQIPDDVEKMGQLNQAISYIRLDTPNMPREALVLEIQKYMIRKIPITFGFSVYESIDYAHANGNIPYPDRREDQLGGHAVTIVGYDLDRIIVNPNNGIKTKGALIIRNSWGRQAGENGYYYLPIAYVLNEQALDFWAILSLEWLNWRDFD
jgi:C1A family cysteine protease